MPNGLTQFQRAEALHFITFSCRVPHPFHSFIVERVGDDEPQPAFFLSPDPALKNCITTELSS